MSSDTLLLSVLRLSNWVITIPPMLSPDSGVPLTILTTFVIFAHTAHGELCLYRDNQEVRCGKRIGREQSQRWRTVNQYIVEFPAVKASQSSPFSIGSRPGSLISSIRQPTGQGTRNDGKAVVVQFDQRQIIRPSSPRTRSVLPRWTGRKFQ